MKLKQKLISIHDSACWEAAISQVPHVYAHMHWYNYAMHQASKRNIFLYVGENDDFCIVCPISVRKKNLDDPSDITTPYGFSAFASAGHYANFSHEWKQFMQDNGFVCGHIALHPFLQNDNLYSSDDLYAGKTSYYIDLKDPPEIIRKGFSTDHRHRLRQWERLNLQVIPDKSEIYIKAFLKNYTAALQSRNAAEIYNFGELAWRQIIASSHSQLFSVTVNGIVEASAIFIMHGTLIDYFMLATTDKGKSHARGMIWEAIKYGCDHGFSWLHLGCGIKENDALEQFKARFGAKPFTTYSLKQIYDENLYQLLSMKYGIDMHDKSGYFPGYWQKHI